MTKVGKEKLRYKIVRIYQIENNERTIREKVTLRHAREHCRNPESAYTTCQKPKNLRRTQVRGPWFDVYRPLES